MTSAEVCVKCGHEQSYHTPECGAGVPPWTKCACPSFIPAAATVEEREPRGTFECPICGNTTPHTHTVAEEMEYRRKTIEGFQIRPGDSTQGDTEKFREALQRFKYATMNRAMTNLASVFDELDHMAFTTEAEVLRLYQEKK